MVVIKTENRFYTESGFGNPEEEEEGTARHSRLMFFNLYQEISPKLREFCKHPVKADEAILLGTIKSMEGLLEAIKGKQRKTKKV